ncbi:MAG: SDR family NAD(P)-dependent oxidoreductase [Planctomycetota bacterium]
MSSDPDSQNSAQSRAGSQSVAGADDHESGGLEKAGSDREPRPKISLDCTELEFSKSDLQRVNDVLEAIVADRGLLLKLSKSEQERFLRAAGQVSNPGRAAKRKLVRAARAERKRAEREAAKRDEHLLESTGIRSLSETPKLSRRQIAQSAPPEPFDVIPKQSETRTESHFVGKLEVARNCYICKSDYHDLHFFYDSMCPGCAEFNWMKRNQSADLSGRYALLTGGRVKIGFEAALKLLRTGANVVVTTRFPRDAAKRFAEVEDCETWQSRLQLYGLDMRHTPSVEALARHLNETLPRLDFIFNNACQTVRRPPAYYQHLMDSENGSEHLLSGPEESWLREYQNLLASSAASRAQSTGIGDGENTNPNSNRNTANRNTIGNPRSSELGRGDETGQTFDGELIGLMQAASMSQLHLTEQDDQPEDLFPTGQYDRDQQQVDLRGKNSWRLKLDEVATVELLEVHLVNAVAPYILNARLKPLMVQTPGHDKHVVNVSAMEGIFYRAFKRDTHPHTNMAKAALNMMTRTSAADYIRDGIHMNSVDTGWITDEDPIEITKRKNEERGFSTPLDCVDAAARICDPVFHGVNSGEHTWGKFLKDYQVSNW